MSGRGMTWTRQQTVGKAPAKALLLLLGVLCDDDDQVKRSQQYIAGILECSISGLKNSLQYLEDGGWITREKRKGGLRSLSDIITLNAATFTSSRPVDTGEEEPEDAMGHEAADGKLRADHEPRDGHPMSHETATAMSHETAHLRDKQILKPKDQTTTGADAQQAPGRFGYPETAQGLIAEWIDHSTPRPLSRIIGHMAREVGNLFAEGVSYVDIRDGLIELDRKKHNPSTLASYVDAARRRPAGTMKPSGENVSASMATGTQRAMEAIAAGQRLQAQHDQQNSLGGITSGLESDRLALGPGSVGGQPEGGLGDHPDVVGNPQPFVFR